MESKEVTREDIEDALKCATDHMQGSKKRWDEHIATGLTDAELEQALKYELGIAGGSSTRDSLSVQFQGSGLKIWASWEGTNAYSDKPVLQGRKTMELMRLIYGIAAPSDRQMTFL